MKTQELLIGGAGYKGKVVTDFFFKKYQVTCLDNFIFNNEYAVNSLKIQKLQLVKGDLRNKKFVKN